MYHHSVSGLANVKSYFDYEVQHDMHIQEYYWRKIKIVGPMYCLPSVNNDMHYQATFGDYDLDCKVGFGYTPNEARLELMEKMGF